MFNKALLQAIPHPRRADTFEIVYACDCINARSENAPYVIVACIFVCRHNALSLSLVVPRHHRISSLCILSRVASSTFVDVALRRVLLRVISCCCALSLSCDEADHCFL